MKLEQQLHACATKSEMHKAIDAVPDDARVLMLVVHEDTGRVVQMNLPVWDNVIMELRRLEHWIFNSEG